ncbi:uncharacterized protein LOC143020620 isoform X2 [Oratosquilla oratoria]
MGANKFFTRVWKDLKNKRFLPLKLIFFLLYGGSMTLFPFLTIYMRSIGITERELALIYLFTPIIGLVGPPITGLLADRLGNFKLFLSFLLVGGGLASLLFLTVPVARIKQDLPDLLTFNMTCNSPQLPPELVLENPYECDLRNETSVIQLSIQYCHHCGSPVQDFCGTSRARSDDCHASSLPFEFSIVKASVDHGVGTTNTSLSVHDSDGKIYKKQIVLVKNFTCPNLEHVVTEGSVKIAAVGESSEHLPRGSCLLSCRVVANRFSLCFNTYTTTTINPSKTFYSYLAVRLFNGVLISTSFSLFTGAAVAVLREAGGEYGLQMLYSNLGSIVLAPISGYLIDYVSKVNKFQDFRPAFYLHCGIKIFSGILVLFINLDFRVPNTTIFRDSKVLLKNPEINAFLLVMIVSGICYGLLDTFLFWFLQDIGANKKLMGLTVTVGYLAGIPMLMVSDTIIKRLGHVNTIVLGLLVYVVRLVGYSLVNNPWIVMPIELLQSITVSLSGAAAVTYAVHLASPSTLATLQGIYGGLHHGVGNSLGSLVGGFLLKPLGARSTFRLTAVVSGTVGILYFLLHIIYFKKRTSYVKKIQVNEVGGTHMDNLEEKKMSLTMKNSLENKNEKTSPMEKKGQVEGVQFEDEKATKSNLENRSQVKEEYLEDDPEDTSAEQDRFPI